MIYAHDWNILGNDRIRRWPSKIGEKRGLTIRISTWVGTVAMGAKHYNLNIAEDENMWWSESENDWVILSCDTEGSGYSMQASMLKPEECVTLAKAWLDLVCGKDIDNHEVNLDLYDERVEAMLISAVPKLKNSSGRFVKETKPAKLKTPGR